MGSVSRSSVIRGEGIDWSDEMFADSVRVYAVGEIGGSTSRSSAVAPSSLLSTMLTATLPPRGGLLRIVEWVDACVKQMVIMVTIDSIDGYYETRDVTTG